MTNEENKNLNKDYRKLFQDEQDDFLLSDNGKEFIEESKKIILEEIEKNS